MAFLDPLFNTKEELEPIVSAWDKAVITLCERLLVSQPHDMREQIVELLVERREFLNGWSELFNVADPPLPGGLDDDDELSALRAEHEIIIPSCEGCRYNALNQQGHMGPGGCLESPRETDEEELDEFWDEESRVAEETEDLNTTNLQNVRQ
jgi:hypothetical protein